MPDSGDLRAELLDDGRLVLAELLADRVELLTQDELTLLLLHPRVDVLTDPAPDLHQSETLALEGKCELEALGDVDGLEDLHLLLKGEIGRVAGRIGERAGIGDRTNERCDSTVVAAELENLLDHRAVLGLERPECLARRSIVLALIGVDEETPLCIGLGGTGDGTMKTVQRHGSVSAGQPHTIRHLGNRANLCVLTVALGDEQDALFIPDVDRQGHVHVREDDDVVERDEQQLAHDWLTLLGVHWGCSVIPSTNYKKCTGIPAAARAPRNLTKRVQTVGSRPESQCVEPGFPNIASRDRTPPCSRALRGRDRRHRAPVRGRPN